MITLAGTRLPQACTSCKNCITQTGVGEGEKNVNLLPPLLVVLSDRRVMSPETIIIDGMDLELRPTNITYQPVKRTTIASGVIGNVHFVWPSLDKIYTIIIEFTRLTRDQAIRLLTALGPATVNSKELKFTHDTRGQVFIIPGKVGLKFTGAAGLWNVSIETIASEFLRGG